MLCRVTGVDKPKKRTLNCEDGHKKNKNKIYTISFEVTGIFLKGKAGFHLCYQRLSYVWSEV